MLVVVGQNILPDHDQNARSFNLQYMQNQKLRVQLYAPDDGQYDARNMLSHK
jgi:hypothetical protein